MGSRKSTAARKADPLREEVRRLVDDLPEEELDSARRYLEFLGEQGSQEEEELTEEERASIARGRADHAAGRVVSHEEVKREFGW